MTQSQLLKERIITFFKLFDDILNKEYKKYKKEILAAHYSKKYKADDINLIGYNFLFEKGVDIEIGEFFYDEEKKNSYYSISIHLNSMDAFLKVPKNIITTQRIKLLSILFDLSCETFEKKRVEAKELIRRLKHQYNLYTRKRKEISKRMWRYRKKHENYNTEDLLDDSVDGSVNN